jgi:hypothetical protein
VAAWAVETVLAATELPEKPIVAARITPKKITPPYAGSI